MGKITTKHMVRDLRKINKLKYSLNQLVDMYWQMEKNHWEETDKPEDHIFHQIDNIKKYLSK